MYYDWLGLVRMAFWVDSFAGGFFGTRVIDSLASERCEARDSLTYLSYGTEAVPAALRSRHCVVLEAHDYPVACSEPFSNTFVYVRRFIFTDLLLV